MDAPGNPLSEVLSMLKRILPFFGVAIVISVAIAFVVASMRASFVREHLVQLKTGIKDVAEKLESELVAEVHEVTGKLEADLPEAPSA
jgi:cytochrome b subunit of formate dehydrogenase